MTYRPYALSLPSVRQSWRSARVRVSRVKCMQTVICAHDRNGSGLA